MRVYKRFMMIGMLFLSLLFSTFATAIPTFESNPFGLNDPTTYDVNTNVCQTIRGNFIIDTHNCLNEDIDGKNIKQNIDFTWNGGSSLEADFIFVYEGALKEGKVSLLQDVTTQETQLVEVIKNRTLFYENISNLVINNGVATFLDTNSTETSISFNEYSQTGSNISFNISVTTQEETLVDVTTQKYVDITNKFNYLGYDLFGKGFRYYSVSNLNFPAGKKYQTKWEYTPQDSSKTGKFHIFGKPSSLSLNQAIATNNYIYQDPWWNATWKYKRAVTVVSDSAYTDRVFSLEINTSNFDYSKTDGTDIRFTDSTESIELEYRRVLWNESGTSTLYIEGNLSSGSNTFYMYYNNSLASDTSNSSLTLPTAMGEYVVDTFGDASVNTTLWASTYSESGGYMSSGNIVPATDQDNGATAKGFDLKTLSDGTIVQLKVETDSCRGHNYIQITNQTGASATAITEQTDIAHTLKNSGCSQGLTVWQMNITLTPSLNKVQVNFSNIGFTSSSAVDYINPQTQGQEISIPAGYDNWYLHSEALTGSSPEYVVFKWDDVRYFVTESYSINSSIASEQTNLEFSNPQLSALSYLDLSADGTNYGKTSVGFVSSESNLFNITPIDDTSNQILVLSRTELDGAFSVYVNDNLVGSSPAYASGTGDWIFEVFEVSSAYLNAGINEINITANSGNGETVFIDYLGLGDINDVSNGIASGGSWVVSYVNISTSDTIDTVRRVIKNESGSVILNDSSVATKTLSTLGTTHLYMYQLPSNENQNYSFGFEANTTTDATLTASTNDPEVEIDSTNPVIDAVTLNLNSYIGESELIYLNATEKNINYVTVDINGTYFNLSQNVSGLNSYWNLSHSYTANNNHSVTFYVYDLVGRSDSFSTTVKVSNITQTTGAWDFNTLFNYTNVVSVSDAFSYIDQVFKVPFTILAEGTAFINDWNGSYSIIDTNPELINITLENGTVRSFSNGTTSLSWLSDSFSNNATASITKTNYLRYNIDKALGVEWENSGVSDTRLFYVNSYNLSNNMTNVTLEIPLRTTYTSNSSSIDVFECTGAIDWNLKTCGQWTEITTTLFNQNDLTWHHWGSTYTDYPTIDSNSDGKKDKLRISMQNISSERMFKIELDSSNGESSWSAPSEPVDSGGSGGGSGGVSSGTSNPISSSTTNNETVTKESSFLASTYSFGGLIVAWIGDNVDAFFSDLKPILNPTATNITLWFIFLILTVGFFIFTGGSSSPSRQRSAQRV